MGWQKCLVPSCDSSKKIKTDIRFFATPAKEERRREWLRLAGKDPDSISGKGRLFCEKHFSESDFYYNESYKRWSLRPNAVPHLNTIPFNISAAEINRLNTESSSSTSSIPNTQNTQSLITHRNMSNDAPSNLPTYPTQPSQQWPTEQQNMYNTDVRPSFPSYPTQSHQQWPVGQQENMSNYTPQQNPPPPYPTQSYQQWPSTQQITRPPLPSPAHNMNAYQMSPSPNAWSVNSYDSGISPGLRPTLLENALINDRSSLSSRNEQNEQISQNNGCDRINDGQCKELPKTETVFCISDNEDDDDVLLIDEHQNNNDNDLVPAGVSLTTEFTEDECQTMYELTRKIMYNHSNHYMALSKQFLRLIDMIISEIDIDEKKLLLTLRKCKLNEPFLTLADHFGISEIMAEQIFQENLSSVAKYFSQFIFWPYAEYIQEHLPFEYKFHYHFKSIQSILDCCEIKFDEAEKSSSNQSIRYIVSYTPYGFINFISEGYRDRNLSDTDILKTCGYLDMIKKDVHVLVRSEDFIGADEIIKNFNGELFRVSNPLNDVASIAPKNDDLFAHAAVLRSSIDRMTSRFNGFQILKNNSPNPNLINHMDNIILIAGALINIKAPHIKLCQ